MKQTYLIKTKQKTSVLSQVSPPVILLLSRLRQEGDGWIQGQLGYVLETLDYKNDCVMLLFSAFRSLFQLCLHRKMPQCDFQWCNP